MLQPSLFLLFLVFACTAPATVRAAEFAFEENVKEALEAGQKNVEAGKLEDAEIDFENALTLDATNTDAMTRLFDVYVRLSKKLPAEALVTRLRDSGKVASDKLAELEKQLEGLAPGGAERSTARGAGGEAPSKGKAADSPAATGAGSAASRPLAASTSSGRPGSGSAGGPGGSGQKAPLEAPDGGLSAEDLSDALADGMSGSAVAAVAGTGPSGGGSDDGLGDLEKELGTDAERPTQSGQGSDGGKGPLEKPDRSPTSPADSRGTAAAGSTTSAGAAPATPPDRDYSKLSPEQKFEASIELAKRKEFNKAIPLYVQALQANNSLLARDDFGLRAISQSYYESRVKTEPSNAQIHFMLGWFAELDSRNDDALKAYRQVVQATRQGDNLHNFAMLKVEQIEALQKSLAMAQQQEREKREAAQSKAQLAAVTQGKAPGLKGPDYLAKGTAAFEQWKKAKAAAALDEALAYFQGALVVDGDNPKTHLAYAKVKIDQAIAGDSAAKDVARKELEKALTLKPDADTKKQIQSLLDGLVGAKPQRISVK